MRTSTFWKLTLLIGVGGYGVAFWYWPRTTAAVVVVEIVAAIVIAHWPQGKINAAKNKARQ